MLKSLLFLVLVPNIFIIVFTKDTTTSQGETSVTDSSDSDSTVFSADSKSSAFASSESSASSTSSSSSASSSSSNSVNIINNSNGNKCPNPNEEYKECPSDCPPQKCGVNPAAVLCLKEENPVCKPGCVCCEGFVRNKDDVCIPIDQCPPENKCPNPNEEYNECPSDCPPQKCGVNPAAVLCLKVENPVCKPGCVCCEGFVRNKDDVCIPIDQCPPESCNDDPNAVPGCGSACERRCSDTDETFNNRVCPAVCLPSYPCVCKPGYIIDDNTGKCVLPEDCPKLTCKANETYWECPDFSCKPQTCDEIGNPPDCEDSGEDCICSQGPACLCQDGFVRDANGNCKSQDECQSCNDDPNAVPGCGSACAKRCLDTDETVKNRSCIQVCLPCTCKPGYIVDDNTGKCVLPENCPKLKCGANETYVECPDFSCKAKTCDEVGFSQSCTIPSENTECPGKPACLCKDGFVRNANGICIPQNECPSCGGDPNAQPGCGNLCTKRCSDSDDKPRVCPFICVLNACTCKPGYVVDDDTGKCILPKQCPPKCGKNEVYSKCPKGGCVGARKCTEIGKKEEFHTKTDQNSCEKGCLCKDGFYRNSKGICVPENQCDNNIPVCVNPNEQYNVCPELCPPKKCGVEPSLILCLPNPKVGDSKCQPGCECIDGYLRNDDGICVPKDQCPKTEESCDGDPNAIPGCGSGCARRCLDTDETFKNRVCPAVCLPCTCKPGYIIDDNTGKCVLPENCPKFKCCVNETYVECPNQVCKAQTCDDYGYLRKCAPIDENNPCQGGPVCLCKDGYLRDDDGNCILQNECQTCGGDPNSRPGCGNLCTKRCSDPDGKPRICSQICQSNACTCKPGYVIDDNTGQCILPEQCPPKCGKNEVYLECSNGNNCGDRNCTEIGQKEKICVKNHQKGCFCKDGYYRNSKGVCVPENQCDNNIPVCDNPNEKYNVCPTICPPKRCGVNPDVIRCMANPEVGDPKCQPGCECIDGYLRNDDGICVPKDQCSKTEEQCTGINEVYDTCPITCPPQYCGVDPTTIKCKYGPYPGDTECTPGCRCADGYLRNSDGVCIPKDQCPENQVSCGGDPNAMPGCGSACPRLCSDTDETVKNKVCTDNCLPCLCKPGYIVDDNTGKCVLPENCPKLHCGVNETYVECPAFSCDAQSCDQLGFDQNCISPEANTTCPGKPACLCQPGFVRDEYGVCIPNTECPSCGGDPNAQAGCGNLCTKHCSDSDDDPRICSFICKVNGCTCKTGYVVDDTTGKCILPKDCPPNKCGKHEVFSNCTDEGCYGARTCTEIGKKERICKKIDPKYCKQGCLCRDGYYRNSKGICVTSSECDNPITCGSNEVYSSCTNGNCYGARKCTEIGRPIICINLLEGACIRGCLCKKGYLRDENNVCIPEQQCPNYNNTQQCGFNEEYVACPDRCDPQTCDTINKTFNCPLKSTEQNCKGECRCKPGYRRNAIGDCITEEQCLQCTGPNEFFSCGSACDTKCSNLSETPSNCPIKNIKCNDKCYCKEGFARDSNNICIPIDQCPVQCTGPNEFYACGSACDTKCSNLSETPNNCPIVNIKCNDKCYCKEGFARDSNNICLPIDQCPEQCTGPNEFFDCGQECDNECGNLDQNRTNCPIINKKCIEKCYCKDGFSRNASGICIPNKECPVPCPNGGNFNSCPPQECDAEYCPLTRDSPFACKSTKNCGKPRCTCGFNQKRDRKTNKCIPTAECPPFECNKENEEYQACPPVCPGQTCEDYLNNATCPKFGKIGIVVQCQPQCRCKEGFYRNYKGLCVNCEECKKEQCTGPNEFFDCGQECDNECGNRNQNRTNCPIINIKCNEKCYCKDGFSRNASGICVPNEECPDFCPEGEEYNTCPPQECDAENCPLTRDDPTSCVSTRNCGTPRCTCGFNRKRNRETGQCVAIADCPPFVCDRPNEVYQACPPVCPGQTCKDYINNTTCPKYGKIGVTIPCEQQCRCKDGYYRNDQGICIKGEECIKDPTCGKNEEFSDCTQSLCRALDCSQKGKPIPCVKINPSYCNRQCVCKKNFLRNKDGHCVPEDQCEDNC